MRFTEPLLGAADEVELARAIEAGVLADAVLSGLAEPVVEATAAELRTLVEAGQAARERFLLANCRLVMSVAHQQARRLGLPADELFQEGFLGLVEAVERWDHALGLRFATFAMTRIRGRGGDAALTRCGQRHVPPWAVRRFGHDVWTGVPLEVDGRELPLPDDRVDVAFGAVETDQLDLPGLLARLPAPERAVLTLRFAPTEPSFEEIGRELGLATTSVRRLHERGLERLRGRLGAAAA